ncbi:hypothetical protein B484DRAFT_438264 [Ochromonadaceae sp. CCMP2298]|nr:hypothetical protein B484DRAFT_438264 [Ochromonadaceae sp. CCMP2298]
MDEYCSPAHYQIFLFRRESQPRYPYPSYKMAKSERDDDGAERRRQPVGPTAPRRETSRKAPTSSPPVKRTPASPSSPAAKHGTCFMSVLREYKVPLKSTQEIPRPCKDSCTRQHFA